MDELAHEVAHHLGLDTENILLFLEDGREVKDRVLLEALDRGGSGEGSNVSFSLPSAYDWASVEAEITSLNPK